MATIAIEISFLARQTIPRKILSREAHGEPSHLPIFPFSESPMFDVNVNVGSGFLMENIMENTKQLLPRSSACTCPWTCAKLWKDPVAWVGGSKKNAKGASGWLFFWGSGWVITYCFSLDFTTLISGKFWRDSPYDFFFLECSNSPKCFGRLSPHDKNFLEWICVPVISNVIHSASQECLHHIHYIFLYYWHMLQYEHML